MANGPTNKPPVEARSAALHAQRQAEIRQAQAQKQAQAQAQIKGQNPSHNSPHNSQQNRQQAASQPQRYVNEGQFLNQGYYENVASRPNQNQAPRSGQVPRSSQAPRSGQAPQKSNAEGAGVYAQMDQDLNPPLDARQDPQHNRNIAQPHQQFADTNYAENNDFYDIGDAGQQAGQSSHPRNPTEQNPQAHNPQAHNQSHLRAEFVQGNEYQKPPEAPVGQPNSEQNIAEPPDTQGVGSIVTFGNQTSNVSSAPSKLSPIIPRDTIIGKSILFIIIAMCFLASLSIVSLLLVQSSVDGWTADIGKQATVQIIPSPERDVQADIDAALEIIRATAGIAQAESLTKNETAKLLEPWIGDGVIGKDISGNDISILDELPIPSLIALEFLPEQTVDLNLLDIALKAAVPGISVDDHKKWLSHLSSIGNILKISAFAVLALVVGITITIIVFATDAAMNSNKSSIEILFLVGAEEGFITREVRHHFLWLGFKAGVIGAVICIGFILLVGLFINIIYAAQFDNLAAARILFGQITLSPYQYIYLLLVPLFSTLIAGVTVHLAAKRIITNLH